MRIRRPQPRPNVQHVQHARPQPQANRPSPALQRLQGPPAAAASQAASPSPAASQPHPPSASARPPVSASASGAQRQRDETPSTPASTGAGESAQGGLLSGIRGWMSGPSGGAQTPPGATADSAKTIDPSAAPKEEGAKKGGWGDWIKKSSGLLPNEKEQADMQFVHDMLAEDKLGGADTTFNQNDVGQIRESLMRDPQTASDVRDALAEAARSGQTPDGERLGLIKRMAARKGAEGKNGLLGGGAQAQQQAWQQARQQADRELNGALDKAGIKPVEGQGPSSVPRTVTRAEMDRFQQALKSFESYSERVKKSPLAKAVGADKDIRPPHGLSQDAVKAIMRGERPKGWVEGKD